MNQHQLPLWDTDHLATYSDVEQYRAHHYPKRGPGLVAGIREEILRYVEREGADLDCLRALNRLVIELSALNPVWFEFSTEVFRTCLFPASTPPKLLQSLFESTLRQLVKLAA